MAEQIDRINGLVGSIASKAPCKVATTGNITLSGAQTIDTISVTETSPRERVLVRAQTDLTENGIYDVSDGEWTRAADFDGARDIVKGTNVFIQEGATYEGYYFEITTTDPVIGTTDIVFGVSKISTNPGTRVKVTSNDTTEGYLSGKLTSTSATLTLTEVNDGGDETFNAEVGDDKISTVKIQDDAITTLKVNDNAITLDKMEHGAQGDILLYGASGVPQRIANGLVMFHRSAFAYNDADQINTGPAVYMCKDKFCFWTTTLTTVATGASGGEEWWYLYLDYSAITSGTEITNAELIWSTTAPTLNGTYLQWMNGDDRCIMATPTDGSSNLYEFFHSENWVIFANAVQAFSGDIDTTWTDVTLTVPPITKRALINHTANISGVSAQKTWSWRVNGQTGTTGHIFLSNYWDGISSSGQSNVVTDSSGKIEVKASASNAGIIAINTDGWYLPEGM